MDQPTRAQIYTSAPEAYDYDYCLSTPIPWTNRRGDQLRIVTMPLESVAYQTGRYRSGMYEAMTPNEFKEFIDLYTPKKEVTQ